MPALRTASTRPHRRKTKREWTIKSKQRTKRDRKGFFALPGELRNQIYELVFTPTPVIEFRRARNSKVTSDTHGHTSGTVVRCDRMMGRYSRRNGAQTKWSTSISAIILVNRQAYKEAISHLYANCIFQFEPHDLAQSFMRTVSKANRDAVTSICIRHEVEPHRPSEVSILSRKRAAQSFHELCLKLAFTLPNITSLSIDLTLKGDLETIIPYFHRPETTYSSEVVNNTWWIQSFKIFADLKKLKSVQFQLERPSRQSLVTYFRRVGYPTVIPTNGQLTTRQICTIADGWATWCEWLYGSIGGGIERLILEGNEQSAWERHREMLDGYQEWCSDPWKDVDS